MKSLREDIIKENREKSNKYSLLANFPYDIFKDISVIPDLDCESDEIVGDMDWEEIHDDSTLHSLFDSEDENMTID